jgi:O-antigen/teichoic acid export membrane protein
MEAAAADVTRPAPGRPDHDPPGLAAGIRGGYLNLAVTWLVQALLVPLLLARLGRDAYGLYATLMSMVGYFALLTFGSALTVPRYVADHAARDERDALSAFVSTYLALHLAIAALGLLAGLALTPLLRAHLEVPAALSPVVAPAWRLAVGGWALGLAAGLFQSFLVGLGDVALANLLNSIRTVLMLAVAFAVLRAGAGLAELLAGLLVASLAGSALAFVILHARHPEIRIALGLARRTTLRATAQPAALFFLMQIAALVVTGTDNVIISVFLGVGQVAPYAVAFQLWSLALAVLWAGTDALLPFFTRWDVRDEQDRLRHAYFAATRYSFAGAALAAIVLWALGDDIVRLWVGGALQVPPGVLATFAAMLLTAAPIHTAALVLTGLGRHRPAALGGAAEAALNLALSLALVRPLGVLGVALGTLCSGALTNAWVAPRAAARAVGASISSYARRSLLPALVPAVAAGALAAVLRSGLPPSPGVLLARLGAIALIFGATFWLVSLDAAERREVVGLLRR